MVISVALRYFGAVAEVTGKTVEDFSLPPKASVEQLRDELESKYPALKTLNYQIAVDRKLQQHGVISPEAEVAILPPFAGG